MTEQPDREIINDVQQRREIEDVFRNPVRRTGRPSAISVAAQIQRVHVIMLAQRSGHPIPVPSMIEAAVHQDKRRLCILSVVPEL
jgi:hypothetical protein